MHRSIRLPTTSQLSGKPPLALLQKMCNPHRGVAGAQFRHGFSKIKSGKFILWAIKQGMMLTIYMLHTRIANSRFIWQSMETAPMALQHC